MKKVPERIQDLPSLAQEIILFGKDMNEDGFEWRLRALLHRPLLITDQPSAADPFRPLSPAELVKLKRLLDMEDRPGPRRDEIVAIIERGSGPSIKGWNKWPVPADLLAGYARADRGSFEYIVASSGGHWGYHCMSRAHTFSELQAYQPDEWAKTFDELLVLIEKHPGGCRNG